MLKTCLIEVSLPPSSLVHSYVLPHACGMQISGNITMADMLQTEAAGYDVAVCRRLIKKAHTVELFLFPPYSSTCKLF